MTEIMNVWMMHIYVESRPLIEGLASSSGRHRFPIRHLPLGAFPVVGKDCTHVLGAERGGVGSIRTFIPRRP